MRQMTSTRGNSNGSGSACSEFGVRRAFGFIARGESEAERPGPGGASGERHERMERAQVGGRSAVDLGLSLIEQAIGKTVEVLRAAEDGCERDGRGRSEVAVIKVDRK